MSYWTLSCCLFILSFAGCASVKPVVGQSVTDVVTACSGGVSYEAERKIQTEIELLNKKSFALASKSISKLQGLAFADKDISDPNVRAFYNDYRECVKDILPRVNSITLTREQYKADLQQAKLQVQEHLSRQTSLDQRELNILKREKEIIENKLTNVEKSYRGRIQALEQAIEDLEKLQDNIPQDKLFAAQKSLAEGRTEQAEAIYKQIEAQASKQIKAAAEARYKRADLALRRYNYIESIAHYRRAADLAADNELYVKTAAEEVMSSGDNYEALVRYQNYLHLLKKQGKESSEQAADVYESLAYIWILEANPDKARKWYNKALDIRLNKYGKSHETTAEGYDSLAAIFASEGNLDKALEYYNKALSIRQLNKDPASLPQSYYNIGNIWIAKKDYKKANEYYEKYLRLTLEHDDEFGFRSISAYMNIALLLIRQGENRKAIMSYHKIIDIYKKNRSDGFCFHSISKYR